MSKSPGFSMMKARKYRLKDGTYIEIYWHVGKKIWAGEFLIENEEDPLWGKQATGYVYSEARRKIPQMLRVAIARARNPNIAKVEQRLLGIHPEDDSWYGTTMRDIINSGGP